MPAAKLFGEPSRLIQMYDIANVGICFECAKINRINIIKEVSFIHWYQRNAYFCKKKPS